MKAFLETQKKDEQYKRIVLKMVEVIAVIAITMIIEYYYFDFYKWDFRIPVTYDGGDAFSGIASMKMRMYGGNDRLGWPMYEDTSSYSPVYNCLSLIGAKVVDVYVDDFFMAQNIFLFLIPTINVLSAYLVFSKMGIKKWTSYLGALTFGFSPYVQMRLFQHQDLVAVECIPIVFMICFWLIEDDGFANLGKKYLKNKRNILLILFGFMIANNGIVYYPFFSCFIMLITGLVVAFRDKTVKKIIPSLVSIFNVIFWLGIGFIPAIRGVLDGRTDVATNGATRDANRAVFYGLDIKSLLLSPHGYGIKNLKENYSYLLQSEYEQYYSYFGIVGILGLILLLIYVIKKNDSRDITENRISLLAVIVVFLIILATSGSVGSIVAIFIPFISSYNRVSIFMLFACVLAVLLFANKMLTNENEKKNRYLAMSGVILLFFVFGLCEQSHTYRYINDDLLIDNTERLEQDKCFFGALEEMAGEGAMVYMLPYMKSFENKGVGTINDYEMYRGYMHTETIKWNYGAVVGGANDVWNKNTSELSAEQMVNELKEKGFAGIYINVAGYEDDSVEQLYVDIIKCLSIESVLVHENGKIIYIPLS